MGAHCTSLLLLFKARVASNEQTGLHNVLLQYTCSKCQIVFRDKWATYKIWVCVCVRESKSEWVCKYSLHGRAIHSVVTVILRDCIDWSWWRMRYQAEGHLSLSVVSLSLCLTHTHTHTHSGTRLERPHEWIEMESNHTVKWLHNNFSFAVFALWVVLFRALLKSTVF